MITAGLEGAGDGFGDFLEGLRLLWREILVLNATGSEGCTREISEEYGVAAGRELLFCSR